MERSPVVFLNALSLAVPVPKQLDASEMEELQRFAEMVTSPNFDPEKYQSPIEAELPVVQNVSKDVPVVSQRERRHGRRNSPRRTGSMRQRNEELGLKEIVHGNIALEIERGRSLLENLLRISSSGKQSTSLSNGMGAFQEASRLQNLWGNGADISQKIESASPEVVNLLIRLMRNDLMALHRALNIFEKSDSTDLRMGMIVEAFGPAVSEESEAERRRAA